jgi:hypothetical protein
VQLQVSASTQNQALSAILFLYRDVLKADNFDFDLAGRARRPERLPVVLSKGEVRAILDRMLNRGGRGVRSPADITRHGRPAGVIGFQSEDDWFD